MLKINKRLQTKNALYMVKMEEHKLLHGTFNQHNAHFIKVNSAVPINNFINHPQQPIVRTPRCINVQ